MAMGRLGRFLPDADRRSVVVLLGGSLVMTLYLYQGQPEFFLRHVAPPPGEREVWWEWYAYLYEFGFMLVTWALLPFLAARIVLRMPAREQGLQLGDWRLGLKLVMVALVIMVPLMYVNAKNPEFQAEYPLTRLAGLTSGTFVAWQASRLIYYIAWEYFFRGFMLFGLAGRIGAFAAIAVQTVPSTIIHFGKPEGEMLAALVAGVIFGAIAWRTRSILYVLIIHWFAGLFTDLFCLLASR